MGKKPVIRNHLPFLFIRLLHKLGHLKMKLIILLSCVVGAVAFTSPSPAFSRGDSALAAKYASKLKFVPLIKKADLPPKGSATSRVAGGLAICVAVDEKGGIYALGDKCPPVNQPLSFGKVRDGTIEDPVLGTRFSLKNGNVVGKWCPSGIGNLLGGLFEPLGVPTYQVKQITGTVFLTHRGRQTVNITNSVGDNTIFWNYFKPRCKVVVLRTLPLHSIEDPRHSLSNPHETSLSRIDNYKGFFIFERICSCVRRSFLRIDSN